MAEELAKKLAKKAEQLKQQKPKEKTPAEIEAEKERERKLEEERKLEAEEKRRKAEEKAEEKHRKAEEKQKAQEEAHQKERSVFVKANEIITNTNEKVVKIETLLNEHNQLEKRYSFKGFEEAQAELKQQLEEEQAQLKQVEEGQKRIEEKLAQIPIQLPKLQTDPLGDPQFQAKILTDLEHYNQRIEKALEQTLSKAEFEQFRHDIEQLLASQKEEKPTTIEDYQFKILRSYIINFHSGRNKPKNTWRASRINNVAQDVSIDIGYFKGIWDDLCQKQWVKQLKEIPEYMIDEEKGEGEDYNRYIITPLFIEAFRSQIDNDIEFGIKITEIEDGKEVQRGADYYLHRLIDEAGSFIKLRVSKFYRKAHFGPRKFPKKSPKKV